MCEKPSCTKTIRRKSRKTHKCYECGAEIVKGDLYQYISGIWDGQPESFKLCLNCHGLFHDAITSLDDYDTPIAFGELADHFMEYADSNHTVEEALSELCGYFGCTEASLRQLIGTRLIKFCVSEDPE